VEAEDSITGSLITQSGVQVSPQHSVVHAVQQSAVQIPIVGEALLHFFTPAAEPSTRI